MHVLLAVVLSVDEYGVVFDVYHGNVFVFCGTCNANDYYYYYYVILILLSYAFDNPLDCTISYTNNIILLYFTNDSRVTTQISTSIFTIWNGFMLSSLWTIILQYYSFLSLTTYLPIIGLKCKIFNIIYIN